MRSIEVEAFLDKSRRARKIAFVFSSVRRLFQANLCRQPRAKQAFSFLYTADSKGEFITIEGPSVNALALLHLF